MPLVARPIRCLGQADAHVQNARSYALPRVFEATRRRGVLHDPLLPAMFPPSSPEASHASSLCAAALSQQLEALQAGQYVAPPARKLSPTVDTPLATRGVAMDKFFDDELLSLVHSMRKHLLRTGTAAGGGAGIDSGVCDRIQIVDLGCGFGTRPWTLPFSSNVSWYDVDLPTVLQHKVEVLEEAGAQLHVPPPHADLTSEHSLPRNGNSNGDSGADVGSGAGASAGFSSKRAGAGAGAGAGARSRAGTAVPLRVGQYTTVVCHMLKADLAEALQAAGWDPASPTIWVAFALIYYLDAHAADLVMKTVAAASRPAPCSAFAGTIMNEGMVELIQESVAAAAAATGSQREPSLAVSGSLELVEGGEKGREQKEEEEEGGLSELSASVDPETSGSISVSDAIRRSKGVQASATSIKFGCRKDAASFLRLHGWEAVEEITPFDVEAMYNILTVGLEYPPELRQAVMERHGVREPLCSVAVGRRGF